MSRLQTHISMLEASSSAYPDSPAFRIPQLNEITSEVEHWSSISYRQFWLDVELYARYWSSVFASDNIPRKSTIGLWLSGMTYNDVLHIYGVFRAGYRPQLCSLRLPEPDIIFELLEKGGARALIYEPSFTVDLTNSPLPIHPALLRVEEQDVDGASLPPILDIVSEDEIAFIFHTSGSTNGSPKLVPCSYSWLDAIVSKARVVSRPKVSGKKDVTAWMGSMCHIAQTITLIGSLCYGSCTIQPTKIAFSSEELVDMINRCGMNKLFQFASFLGTHLRNSKQDKKLLQMLMNLDEIVYSGLPLGEEEGVWADKHRIPIRNLFGNTECGPMMLTIGGTDRNRSFLRPIEGTSYAFMPLSSGSETEGEPVYKNMNDGLLELVILSQSPDCPHPSLRKDDGHFHTGDLFLEVEQGSYISRGRMDDWIKSENSLRCDTKSVEDNARATCADLIFECIVVGNGRPSPTLFVEPLEQATTMDIERLKKEIIRRTRQFHSRRYIHEKIISTKFIIVVERGSLPRTATKGNVRRKAVEDNYQAMLDDIYNTNR